MTNEELVELIQKGIDVQKNLGILYEQNKRFIYTIVKPFMKYADPDDLLQEGYIGFQEAIFAYNPGETKLTTYSVWKIRQHCIRYIENFANTKRIPSHLLHLMQKYKSFVQSYRNEHGTEPSDEVIMEFMELSKSKLNHIRKTLYEQNCISITAPIPGADNVSVEDSVADDYDMETDIEDKLFREHERKVLDCAIQQLQQNEQEVINSRYWDDLTQNQVAEKMNISSSRVGAIERKALKNLKRNDELQRMVDEVYGYNSKMAYGISRKYCLDHHTSPTEMIAMKRIMLEEQQKKVMDEVDAFFDDLLA